MSKAVSRGQALQVSARVATQINWDELDGDALQSGVIDLTPENFGRRFTDFLKNGARVQIVGDYFKETGELTIQIPALPRPTLEQLQKRYSFIKSIEADDSPTEPVTLVLGTVLRPDEKSINGMEYEYRLRSLDGKFGYQQGEWLVLHQDEYPDFMNLLGKIYIDLPGIKALRDDGGRDFPCLSQDGKRWCLRWDWFGTGLVSNGRVARSGK